MKKIQPAKFSTVFFFVFLGLFSLAVFVFADWTPPPCRPGAACDQPPPACPPGAPGCDRPITVGPETQAKIGAVTIENDLYVDLLEIGTP